MSSIDDRFSELPSAPIGDVQPIRIPDLRKRPPLWKRAIRWLIALAVVAALVVGLVVYGRWSQRREVEQLIRKQFPQQAKQSIDSLTLTHLGDGQYEGTLVTTDGDTLELSAEVTSKSGTRWINWRTRYPLAQMQKQVREDFERNNQPVRSVDLRRDSKGLHVGRIVLQTGEEFDISEVKENDGYRIRYDYAVSTVEQWAHQEADLIHHDRLTSVKLERGQPDHYSGSAQGASGVNYSIRVEPNREDKKSLRTTLTPQVNDYPQWVKLQIERTMNVKVKDITLKPRAEGDSAGQAVLTTGEVYDVRVGTPPSWRKTPKDGEVTWRALLAPISYEDWIKTAMENQYGQAIVSLKLKRQENGEYTGIATDELGQRYKVRVWKTKKLEEGKDPDWPDLGGSLDWAVTLLD